MTTAQIIYQKISLELTAFYGGIKLPLKNNKLYYISNTPFFKEPVGNLIVTRRKCWVCEHRSVAY